MLFRVQELNFSNQVVTGQLAQRSEMIAASAEKQGAVANQVVDSLVVIRDSVEETEQVSMS